MDTKKLQEILADEAFAKSLLELETAEEVQAALKEKGLEISVEELCRLRDKLIVADNGELNDDELDAVAGGFNLGSYFQTMHQQLEEGLGEPSVRW